MSLFYYTTKYCFKTLFVLCYKHKVYGIQHVPNGPSILAPNHASFFDPPIICASAPGEAHYLARGSLFHKPFLRFLINKLNAYPVTGGSQDLSSFKLVVELLKKGQKVVIFPEGQRSYDGTISHIKPGIGMLAVRCSCPIVPIYIHGTYSIWNRHRKYPRLWGKTACVFGTPIYPQDIGNLSKKEAQEALSKRVDTSIKDLKHWYLSGAIGIPP